MLLNFYSPGYRKKKKVYVTMCVFFFFSLSFGYSPGLSLELQDFTPKCTCYLCTSVTNVTKLSIRPYVVNVVLHCPHPPSGPRPTERSLWEMLSAERSYLAYVTPLLGVAPIQHLRGLVPSPQLETRLMSLSSTTWINWNLCQSWIIAASLSAHFYFSLSLYQACSREQSWAQ